MGLIDKIQESNQNEFKSTNNEELIKSAFKESAEKYWGKVGEVRVMPLKETESGTKYYLIIADTMKKGEKNRLLQKWYISSKTGEPKHTTQCLEIPDEFSDEVGSTLFDDYSIE